MLLSEEELKASSEQHPEVTEWLKKSPFPPLDWHNPPRMRASMAAMDKMALEQLGPADPEQLVESYQDVQLRDGATATMKVWTPAKPPPGGSPLIVYAYGGGFVSGSAETGTAMNRDFVRVFGAVVVNVSYRLAPEHKFPTAQLDAWEQLKWCSDHASELKADPSKGFIISGTSAGGSVASVLATKAIEEPLSHPLTGQWLAVPTILDLEHTPEKYKKYFHSLEHNANAPIIGAEDVVTFNGLLEADNDDPLRYPVNSKAPLSKQPKAYIQADGQDPLRDDALIWEEILKEAGVPTRIDFYPGCPHAHFAFMPGTEVGDKANMDVFLGLAWLLGVDLTAEEVKKRAGH